MILLDGKKARDARKEALAGRIARLGFSPTLAIIQAGENPDSALYIAQKVKLAASVGARVEQIYFPHGAQRAEIERKVAALNADPQVHGIIVQLPLPQGIDPVALINLIDPSKDVDGLTDENQALLSGGTPRFVPATARGIMSLLDFYSIDVKGKKVAVLGRSRLVGGPTAALLRSRGADVAVCHSKTENTRDVTKASDIVIVAIGKPELIDASYIRPGSIVIDVGINARGKKLEEEIPRRSVVGDVDFAEVSKKAGALSPVPGGVGPMTVVSLIENLVDAAEISAR